MRAVLRQLLLVGAALALCPVASALIGTDPTAPLRRGLALADAERALGLHVEPAVWAFTRGHPWLLEVAGLVYVLAHVGVTGWALVWTWCLRRDAFARVRDTWLIAQALCVVGYVALPTAPPRLVAGGMPEGGLVSWFQSPYAAMPSGHVAFALVAGATFARLGDRRWLRAFGWFHPPLIVLVTIATGHHLWLDAAGAVLVAGAAALAAAGLHALRVGAGAAPSGVRSPQRRAALTARATVPPT